MRKLIAFLVVFMALGAFASAKTLQIDPFVCPVRSENGGSELVLDILLAKASGLTAVDVFNYQSTAATCVNRLGSDCFDTDGGIVPEVAGSVNGTFYHGGEAYAYEFHDFCNPCMENTLIEFYCRDVGCDNELPAFEEMHCRYGCRDGACIEDEIPEFGMLAAGIALIGALAGFFVLRKKN